MEPLNCLKNYFKLTLMFMMMLSCLSLAHGGEAEITFLSGGIGQGERVDMQEKQKNFNFWLSTASLASGKYISDVQVSIFYAEDHQQVFKCIMDGPWLMLKLPAGRYELIATYKDSSSQNEQVIRKVILLTKTQMPKQIQQIQKMVIYFKAYDDVTATSTSTSE